jgi:hypothetical protein
MFIFKLSRPVDVFGWYISGINNSNEGREKPHIGKYWNYDGTCALMSLLIWDLEILSTLFLLHRVYLCGMHDEK